MPALPPGLSAILRLLATNVAVCAVLYEGLSLGAQYSARLPHIALWKVTLATPVLVFVALLLQGLWTRLQQYLEMKRMGGTSWPVVRGKKFGNMDLVDKVMEGRANGYPCDFMEEWVEEYGPQHDIKILGGSQLFTADPVDVKFILATEFSSFEKGPTFREAARSLLGFGVFNADGELWKFHRSMSRPFFNRDRISDFDIFSRHSATVFRKITERLDTGVAVDFQDAIARFAMDSASEFLFGTSVESLHDPLPYPWNSSASYPGSGGARAASSASDRFVSAFAGAQLATAHRFWRGPAWKFSEITTDKTKPHMREIDAFITPILQRALLRKRQNKARNAKSDLPVTGSSDDEGTSLLDHLVSLTDDVKVIKDEIVNILVAGRDTTSVTLTFAVYFMAIHPDVLRRAREEVLARFGTTRTPSFEDMRELKYLRAVINETLRLMPPVPLNVRYANKSVLMPSTDANGKHYYVAAGDPVAYSVFLMQRRKELWGPDAEEFDPDRFLDERLHRYLTPNPYIFVPFNAGPRICLGQQFAYNEMTYFLIRLLQRFDGITLDKDAMPPHTRPPQEWKSCKGRKAIEQIIPTAALTLSVKGGLWVRMHEAADAEKL